ncbi:MAG: ABC transporter ATP-binding protein, partial [Tannerella sp.]|nr:ABC transporter ATP-binding protein [Tannerella sp.]
NGAGKTTIISILCGLKLFDSGDVRVCNYSIKNDREKIKTLIGVVPQDIALYPELTARENLKIFGGIYGIGKTELNARMDELLNLFGLEKSKNRYISTYSGGMKRRVNLIAGLLHRPQLLFLDEPTEGIDVQSRRVILENLREINRTGTTIVYTSHLLSEAENFCTSIALIDEGQVICRGEPSRLIAENSAGTLEDLFLQKTGKNPRDP